MVQKTGKIELFLVLLVALCLNLSFFHSHSIWNDAGPSEGHIPHHITEEVHDCPACQHTIHGIGDFQESTILYTPSRQKATAGNPYHPLARQPSVLSNKSPPTA